MNVVDASQDNDRFRVPVGHVNLEGIDHVTNRHRLTRRRFIAGILKGSVFPEFYALKVPAGRSYFQFAWQTLPTGAEEFAKLFVWSFLAGFAERLVPDSLDRLSSKLDPDNKPGAAKLPAADPKGLVQPSSAPTQELKPKLTPETLQNVLHSGEVPPEQKADHNS